MFTELINKYKKNDFEIFIGGCFLLLFILFIFRLGKNGSYSTTFYLPIRRGGGGWGESPLKKEPKVSSGEKECRRVLEELFKRPFPNERPDFLRNTVTGGLYNLEIDCYNEGLKLGVEYSGVQHYKFIPFFHKNKEAFMNQKYRDELKRRICKDNNVVLIEVPYTIKVEDIKGFLIDKLRQTGYIRQ